MSEVFGQETSDTYHTKGYFAQSILIVISYLCLTYYYTTLTRAGYPRLLCRTPNGNDYRQPDYRTYLTAYERAWQRYHHEPTEQHRDLVRTGVQPLYGELMKPGRFELGQAVATPGAVEAMQRGGHIPPEFLLRHKHGDWGDLDVEDKCVNEDALRHRQRLLSAYHTRLSDKLWVITEWDRSATTLTLLLPEEY